jgi:hypothetical protein
LSIGIVQIGAFLICNTFHSPPEFVHPELKLKKWPASDKRELYHS